MNLSIKFSLACMSVLLFALYGCDGSQEHVTEDDASHSPLHHPFVALDKRVEVDREADNNFAWVSKFSYKLREDLLIVSVRIAILPVETVRPVRLYSIKREWLNEINKKWNNRFRLILSNGSSYPIEFKVKFSPINPDHKVIVRKGSAANQHNWTINMPVEAAAHEFGHMLGAYDEYSNGALAFESPIIDRNSIMGSRLEGGYPYPRHLALLMDNIRIELNDAGAHAIVPNK